MKEQLKAKVKELFEKAEVDAFLGLKEINSYPFPYLFTPKDQQELDALTIGDVRYPLSKIILKIHANYPDKKIAIMVRACDERALWELFKNSQLDPQKIIMLGVGCPEGLKKTCSCPNNTPSDLVAGEVKEIKFSLDDVKNIETMKEQERLNYWINQFGKCIKCYGCRNICPVCFCETCTLEDEGLVHKGDIPPEIPAFHLARAFHMMGRCIDCGLCEEACPVDIPLRTLYRKVREIGKELFDYLPGQDKETVSPLQLLGDGTFEIRQ